MKIIIIGAGQVGTTLAENLANEQNDVTVIDINSEKLRILQNHLDVRTIQGFGSYPDILIAAGAESADMLIAVCNSDETNMIACQIAHLLFHIPHKIARLRATQYLSHPELFTNQDLAIDLVISPEDLVTEKIISLIDNPGALEVTDFAHGRVQLIAINAYYGGPLIGKTINDLKNFTEGNMRILAIYRRGKVISINEKLIIKINDEILFMAERKNVKSIMAALRRLDTPYRYIMIAGANSIGRRLASRLEDQYQIKLIDSHTQYCELAARRLHNSTILLGEPSDTQLLTEENIEKTDVFCAITDDDETNIMSALQAKRLGVRKVMALVSRPTYVDLIRGGDIDIAVSPQLATIDSILSHLRKADVVNIHSLHQGRDEVIEIIAHGDAEHSKVVGKKLIDICLPAGTTIGAVVRDKDQVLMSDETIIETDDHLIIFLSDKEILSEIEKLFKVTIDFFG